MIYSIPGTVFMILSFSFFIFIFFIYIKKKPPEKYNTQNAICQYIIQPLGIPDMINKSGTL